MIEIFTVLIVTLAVLILFILCSVGWGIGTYNTFRVGQQDIKTQWSNIKTEYQRRADLFLNLVESVKSYKKFEKDTLTQVIQARVGNFGAGTLTGVRGKLKEMKGMSQLDSLFQRLLMVSEQYPKLQANEQHNKLMDEIRITEDRVNVARTDYNEIVGDYNKVITMFPSNLIANLFKFPVELFYTNEKATEKAPKINLD